MNDLNGAKIALLEARMDNELANLVRRFGGEPIGAKATREVPLPCDDEVRRFVDALRDGGIQIAVFLTGVGVNALFDVAGNFGRADELAALLSKCTVVCRGPKPTAALKKRGIVPQFSAESPFTGHELLEAMAPLKVDGLGVGLLHYGERSQAISEGLASRGARLVELCLYEWQLPEDIKPLEAMVRTLARAEVAAVAFTSQVQVRHLFQVAAALGEEAALRDALSHRVIVASVGPTCTSAIEALGIRVSVEPESPKMGPMLAALADRLASLKS